MFGIFKKKARVLPKFQYLNNYSKKDKYFIRTMQWDWLNDQMVQIFDNKSPRIITMDEWPQQIYLDASGQKTIGEYILWMANQYAPNTPLDTLDEDIIRMIENLIEDGGMIKLLDQKTSLPYYLDDPKSKQNLDKAYELMKKDGYLKK